MKMAVRLLCAAIITLPSYASALDATPVTRDPRENPQYKTYEQWRNQNPETGTINTGPTSIATFSPLIESADGGLIAVVVADNLNSTLEDELNQYTTDLILRGYTVERSTYSVSGTVEDLKEYLQGKLIDGLTGAVLVGNLPIAWYQIDNDFDGNGAFDPGTDTYEEFPCDLFLSDLDGSWSDDSTHSGGISTPMTAGSDDIYDSHSGDREPEIWVSRIDASNIQLADPTDLYADYFSRIHSYRQAEETFPSKALVYVDHDWISYFTDHDVDKVCDTVVEIRDDATTDADDYTEKIANNGLYLTVYVHSTPDTHHFHKLNLPVWDLFSCTDLYQANAGYAFYNLFACSGCRWIEQDCLGSLYQFCGSGLASIGSVKTGSMLDFSVFNTSLSEDKSWGEAFVELTNYWMDYYPSQGWDNYGRSWYMGLCLLGDGTLDMGDQLPVAISEERNDISNLIRVSEIITENGIVQLNIPVSQDLDVVVFNSAGRKQTSLFKGHLTPGNHLLNWDVSDYSPGVYFVSINTQHSKTTCKTTVIK